MGNDDDDQEFDAVSLNSLDNEPLRKTDNSNWTSHDRSREY
jgi:hypothetical protein